MPKLAAYPPRGMKIQDAIEVAKIVYNNGKTLKLDTLAELLGMKRTGGGFNVKYNSPIKYGLLEKHGEEISVTPIVKEVLNPIDEDERKSLLFKVLTAVPLYKRLIEDFKDTGLPDDDKLKTLLIRQYDVNEKYAGAVRNGFIKSLQYLEIFNASDRTILLDLKSSNKSSESKEVIDEELPTQDEPTSKIPSKSIVYMQKEEIQRSVKLNDDVFNLIVNLSSHLEPISISVEDTMELLDQHENLTHVKYPFEMVKEDLENNEISEDKLRILLDALKQDLI